MTSDERRRRRERSRTSAEGTAFMDVAREAFVRYVALEKWREIDDLRQTLDMDVGQAVAEAARFPTRGRYAPLWERRWAEEVAAAAPPTDAGAFFAAVERAVAAAVADEIGERRARGDRPFEEDAEYKRFLDQALERLGREAAGGIGTP